MNFDARESAFPINISSVDSQTGAKFDMQVVGGMTLLTYTAIELFKGLLSNPVLVNPQLTTTQLRKIAFSQAQDLLKECNPSQAELHAVEEPVAIK